MEVAKLNLGGMNQQILYHKSGFMPFFEINVESLHLVPTTCLVSVQTLEPIVHILDNCTVHLFNILTVG